MYKETKTEDSLFTSTLIHFWPWVYGFHALVFGRWHFQSNTLKCPFGEAEQWLYFLEMMHETSPVDSKYQYLKFLRYQNESSIVSISKSSHSVATTGTMSLELERFARYCWLANGCSWRHALFITVMQFKRIGIIWMHRARLGGVKLFFWMVAGPE